MVMNVLVRKKYLMHVLMRNKSFCLLNCESSLVCVRFSLWMLVEVNELLPRGFWIGIMLDAVFVLL